MVPIPEPATISDHMMTNLIVTLCPSSSLLKSWLAARKVEANKNMSDGELGFNFHLEIRATFKNPTAIWHLLWGIEMKLPRTTDGANISQQDGSNL